MIIDLLNLTQSAFQGLGVIKPLPNCEQPVNLKPHGPVGLKNSHFRRGPSHSTDFGVKEPYTVKHMNIFGHSKKEVKQLHLWRLLGVHPVLSWIC